MGLMIFFSHYSQRFANLLGTNPVSVLATLILKPFMDSYHAPYKGKHRYWPGLLLVLRFALLLVFALNRQHDTSINLLATLLGSYNCGPGSVVGSTKAGIWMHWKVHLF